VFDRFVDMWQAEADVKTYGEAVADVMRFRERGRAVPDDRGRVAAFARRASFYESREKARTMGINVIWDCEHAKTPDGYYQVRGGIDYAIAKSLAVAPYADLLWMETKTADLHDAKKFADAIHAKFPDKMLAYNLSPSFNWDTTGMTTTRCAVPGGARQAGLRLQLHHLRRPPDRRPRRRGVRDGAAQDGMLALARLQRKFRLVESPYRTPQTLVGGPRADAALMSISGRTSTTKAMGKGSTQFQHLVQTEVPPKLLEEWLEPLAQAPLAYAPQAEGRLRPHSAGSELLELSLLSAGGEKAANVIFATIQDRRGRNILSVRDQNTFDEACARSA
jgi:isocitrate lyase